MKVAISVPEPIFEAAEKLAKSRSVARSKLYTEALTLYVNSQSESSITQKLNEVYEENASALETPYMSAQCQVFEHETW